MKLNRVSSNAPLYLKERFISQKILKLVFTYRTIVRYDYFLGKTTPCTSPPPPPPHQLLLLASPSCMVLKFSRKAESQRNTILQTTVAKFRTLSETYDGAFCQNSSQSLPVNYFRKTLHHRFLTGSECASERTRQNKPRSSNKYRSNYRDTDDFVEDFIL